MKENYFALYLAIIKGISVDAALLEMGINVRIGIRAKTEFKYIDDPERLMELKKKHTYKELVKMYNTYPDKIFTNIKHYKQVSL